MRTFQQQLDQHFYCSITLLYYDLPEPKWKYVGSMWAGWEARDKQRIGELVSNNWNGKANKPILSKAWNINPILICSIRKFFNFGSMCAGREARDKQRVGELVSNNWNGKANTQVHKHCRLVRPKSLPLRSFGIESGDWIEVKRLIKTSKRGL